MSPAAGGTSDDYLRTGSKQPPPASSTKSSGKSSGKSPGRCPQTHFLLYALTVGQVVVILLFFLWTIKACYIRYHRVFIATAIDASATDPRYQSARNASHQDDITHHYLHGNYSNITTHLDKDGRLEWKVVRNNESRQMANTKRNIRIVGSTNAESLAFTLNWLESFQRLNLHYNVTLITEDERSYEILTRRKQKSKKFDRTQFIAGRRSEGGRIVGLSLADCDVVLDILASGIDVLRIAADSVWLKDPLPLLWQKYNQCDLRITFGGIRTQSLSLAFLKSSPNVISYVTALKEQLRSSSSGLLTNAMALKLGLIMLRFNVRLCFLEENHFPSEQLVFQDGEWYKAHKENIFVVRTGAIKDTSQKQYLLQMKNMWYLSN